MKMQTLDELVQYVHRVMPQAKAIEHLQRNGQASFIDFKWNGHHFAVRLNLEAFELKDTRLFITGASMLVQAALARRSSNEQTIGALVQTLEQAEDIMKTRPQEGLSMVGSVKGTIRKLIKR